MTTLRCRVILLDDTIIERDLEKKAVGQVLFDQVCEYLNLLERDYFGLEAWDSFNNKMWLDFTKQVHKQIIGHDATFTLSVKFYPPDPSVLAEDITRYLLCLQLRADILRSRLPCPSDMLAVLGSYTIQSEFGDYNPELHGKDFFTKIPLAPNQTPELEEKVTELHQTLKSMSPAQADQLFLQNVRTLDMYGVHLHHAKDASGEDVMLGVCSDGLMVYENEEKTQSFIWPKVVNVSYKRRNFYARIFQSEDASENTIKFILPSYHTCKCLWRNAVEQHAFFRNQEKTPERLLKLGSRFRFQGLTHAESLEASATISRPAPRFSRSAIKRKAKESLHVALKHPNPTESDDWFLMLSSDESRPTYGQDVHTEKDKLTGQETLAYKEKREVDKLDNEWFQLFGGRSFPTQHSLSFLSSDTDILESAKFQLWKLQADDWFVLLEPCTYYPTFSPLKTLPLSLQTSQAEEQKEQMEWMEKTSGRSIKVVKIRTEFKAETEQHEELEMERELMIPDTLDENFELDTGVNEKILRVMRETIERNGDGEKIQKEVMYDQRTQDLEPYIGQSQEAFVKQRTRGGEAVETVHALMLKTSEAESEENIEDLEKTLLEVESIGQRLQDIERLKVRLQEVEMLEQKIQEMQQEERRQEESDDWYILLEPKLMETLVHKGLLEEKTSEQMPQDIEEEERQQPAGQKAEDKQRIKEEVQRANSLTPVQMKDDWYILLELPKYTQARRPALPLSEDTDIQTSWVQVGEEHKSLGKEMKWSEEKVVHVTETQPTLPAQREEQRPKEMVDDWFIQLDAPKKSVDTDIQSSWVPVVEEHKNLGKEEKWPEKPEVHVRETQPTLPAQREEQRTKEVDDDWFIQFEGLRPQQMVTIKEKEVTFDKKPMVVGEKQVIVRGVEKNFPATTREDEDSWFVLFTPVQIGRKSISTAGVSDSWILEEKRLREVQKGRLREDVKRSHVVEDKRHHPYVPEPKVKEHHMVHDKIDEWFTLLEPVSKKSVSVDKRAKEDQHGKKEVFKKQVIGEDRKKVAGFKPPSVPTIPLTPSDHPITSTPTAQYVRTTRPTYQEESLKRLDITQDITQDIKQELKVETESIIMRKRRKKRIEGESIYIRHSMLMLEDSDVTQEILLKHHASISELKRHFMEDIPVYSHTEWDRRLSTYTPVIFPKISNGELFTGIDVMRADGLLTM